MAVKAVFLGAIGVIAETSDIQREAYNDALRRAGLNWNWTPETYKSLLNYVGGRQRLKLLSEATGAGLTDRQIETVHRLKTEIAIAHIRKIAPPLRPGVVELIRAAQSARLRLGFVTSTEQANIDVIRDLVSERIGNDPFDVVIGRADIARPKPWPDAYREACERLSIAPADVLAIEDTPASAQSAKRAGLQVILVPGAFATGVEFAEADIVLPSLLSEGGGLHPTIADRLAQPALAS